MRKGEHSIERRLEVLAALDAGESISATARRFGMAWDTVKAFQQLRDEYGSVEPRPRKPTKFPKLTDAERQVLVGLRRSDPAATLEVITERFVRATGTRVHLSTVWKELTSLGFKKVRVPTVRAGQEQPTGAPGGYQYLDRSMKHRRYPSDLSDKQWAVVQPFIPEPKSGGRPVKYDRRVIVDAILYVMRTGCQWRALPHDFPPWSTVYDLFRQWRDIGVWERANTVLRERVRESSGRLATPSAAIIDSQVARTTEKGGPEAMTAARK